MVGDACQLAPARLGIAIRHQRRIVEVSGPEVVRLLVVGGRDRARTETHHPASPEETAATRKENGTSASAEAQQKRQSGTLALPAAAFAT